MPSPTKKSKNPGPITAYKNRIAELERELAACKDGLQGMSRGLAEVLGVPVSQSMKPYYIAIDDLRKLRAMAVQDCERLHKEREEAKQCGLPDADLKKATLVGYAFGYAHAVDAINENAERLPLGMLADHAADTKLWKEAQLRGMFSSPPPLKVFSPLHPANQPAPTDTRPRTEQAAAHWHSRAVAAEAELSVLRQKLMEPAAGTPMSPRTREEYDCCIKDLGDQVREAVKRAEAAEKANPTPGAYDAACRALNRKTETLRNVQERVNTWQAGSICSLDCIQHIEQHLKALEASSPGYIALEEGAMLQNGDEVLTGPNTWERVRPDCVGSRIGRGHSPIRRPMQEPVATPQEYVMLKPGTIRQDGDEWECGGRWFPVPEQVHGAPIPQTGAENHRRKAKAPAQCAKQA